MRLFCKHSVCAECRVLFEPPTAGSIDRMWPNLCETHRKPEREKWERRQRVKQWAESNFERLEKQMLQEQEAERAKYNDQMQQLMQTQFAQQAAMQNRFRQYTP